MLIKNKACIFYRSLIVYCPIYRNYQGIEAKLSEGNQEELLILEMNKTKVKSVKLEKTLDQAW